MNLPLIERWGDWNPQLFREIKGRFKPRNLTITIATSLVGQLLVLMNFTSQLPVDGSQVSDTITNRYCTGVAKYTYSYRECLRNAVGSFEIDWQLWSFDVFIGLSLISIFVVLVAGTHMLIGDLSKEEHRGTLNFIRLSPQSSQSILIGKLLGVPSLLYLAVALVVPLHLWLGLSAQIPLSSIFIVYSLLAVASVFFYSASLLYSLVSARLGGFQTWFGSGAVLLFLLLTTTYTANTGMPSSSMDWVILFNPSSLLRYPTEFAGLPEGISSYFNTSWSSLKFFGLPVGANIWIASSLMVLNYALWTYWIWQGLSRCFHNSSITIFSKHQSYLLTACFEVSLLGFVRESSSAGEYRIDLFTHFSFLLFFNLLLCLFLIAALSPHRQTLQDWARYRHQNRVVWKKGILRDLIWGEQSPAIVAIGLNLGIMATIMLPWMLLWSASENKAPAFLGLLLFVNSILIYAAIAQLMLFMKTAKRGVWAAGTVATLIVLPVAVFAVLSIEPTQAPTAWLFSTFAWVAVKDAATAPVLLTILGEWLTLTLLGLQLTRQMQRAGESTTKALFAGRASLPSA